MLKDFKKFFEEISIKDDHPSFSDDYLSRSERKAKSKIREQGIGSNPNQIIRELMTNVGQFMTLARGKEREFSQLATQVIYDLYKDVIDRYGIELDIKIVQPQEMKTHCEESEDDGDDDDELEAFKELFDEDIKNEVFKRKIANLVIQGEGKNTKTILQMPEVADGIRRILGPRNGDRAVEFLMNITKLANALDWAIEPKIRSKMIEGQQMAGVSKVDWKPKPKKEKSKKDKEKDDENKDSQSKGKEEDLTEDLGFTPVIKARAVDFSLLLHEAVKSLYELLSVGGIPKDKKIARTVFLNTGHSDEPEDWQYGPEVAGDLRDFVNQNPKIDKYPNLREELYKYMIDKETMPVKEFLELFKGILNNTDEARRKVDSLLDKVIKLIDDEKKGKQEMDKYEQEMEKYKKDLEKYEKDMEDYKREIEKQKEKDEDEDDIEKVIRSYSKKDTGDTLEPGDEDDGEDEIEKLIRSSSKKDMSDPSNWSKKQIMDEIDIALDNNDMERVSQLSKYLESRNFFNKKYKKLF